MRFTLFILAMSSLSLFANQNTFICRQALAKISAEVSERLKVRGVTEALPIQEMLLITSKESTQNTPGLKKQADEVAEFLSNLFVAARGNEIFLPFREVRIAESKWFGSRMSMEGDTLVIHPPISSTQLSTYFKAGKHLEMGPFWNRNPVRQYWKFINPIGDFRVMLRNQLELATTQLKSHLTKLEESPSLHKLLDLVDPHRLEPHRLKLLKSMSPEDLKKIISTWKTETENTQHIEGFENALASSVKSNRWVRFGPKHEVSPDIDSYQFGLVSVGNYHNIEVNLSKESEYHRYLNPVSEARPKVKSVSIGLIASVYTVDRVQVNVESALSKAIETYLLDKALSLWAQK